MYHCRDVTSLPIRLYSGIAGWQLPGSGGQCEPRSRRIWDSPVVEPVTHGQLAVLGAGVLHDVLPAVEIRDIECIAVEVQLGGVARGF